MNNRISRRDLFVRGAKSTAAISLASVVLPQAAKGASGEELATLIDLGKCIGCESCVYACKDSNTKKYPEPFKPFPVMHPVKRVKAEDWSEKRDETSRLTPYTWLFIQRVKVYWNGKEHELNIPRRCMHCQNPPCVNLCPWGSATKKENGITVIDSDLCLGGAKCRDVCPWKIPQRQTGVGLYLKMAPTLGGNGVLYKCDRCYDKIAQGGTAACISECPEGVQKIGPRSEIIKEARAAADSGLFVYGIDENGGTNTVYLSPVPFDVIDRALEKGDGKPHMGPVGNSMAGADMMSKAMIIAPLAGIAAAVGRNYNMLKKLFSGEKDNNG